MNWYLVKAEQMREPSAEIVLNLGDTTGRELTSIKATGDGELEVHLTRLHPTMDPTQCESLIRMTGSPIFPNPLL